MPNVSDFERAAIKRDKRGIATIARCYELPKYAIYIIKHIKNPHAWKLKFYADWPPLI
jgi:hypothetical protein